MGSGQGASEGVTNATSNAGSAIEERVASLRALDDRLAALERHLNRPRRTLAVLDQASEPCCDAAGAVVGNAEGTCACCATPAPA